MFLVQRFARTVSGVFGIFQGFLIIYANIDVARNATTWCPMHVSGGLQIMNVAVDRLCNGLGVVFQRLQRC